MIRARRADRGSRGSLRSTVQRGLLTTEQRLRALHLLRGERDGDEVVREQVGHLARLQIEARIRQQAHRRLHVGGEVGVAHRVPVLDVTRDPAGVHAVDQRPCELGARPREPAGVAVGQERPRGPHGPGVDDGQRAVVHAGCFLDQIDPTEPLHLVGWKRGLEVGAVHRGDPVRRQLLVDVVIDDAARRRFGPSPHPRSRSWRTRRRCRRCRQW